MPRINYADRPTRDVWPENMRRDDLACYLRCSVANIDKWRATGRLPPGKKLGGRVVIWQKSAIDEWFKNLPNAR